MDFNSPTALVNKTMEKIQSRNFAVNLMTPIQANKEKEYVNNFLIHSTPIERVEYESEIKQKVRSYRTLNYYFFLLIE